MIRWHCEEPGRWVWIDGIEPLVVVYKQEIGLKPWGVYVDKVLPPGYAQFRTLREAKGWAEKRIRKEEG
jgi:hypothetical protein